MTQAAQDAGIDLCWPVRSAMSSRGAGRHSVDASGEARAMGMLVGSGGLPVGDDCGTGVPLLHRGGPVVRWLVGPDGDAVAARCGVCRAWGAVA